MAANTIRFRKGQPVLVDTFGFKGADLRIEKRLTDGYYSVRLGSGLFNIHRDLIRSAA